LRRKANKEKAVQEKNKNSQDGSIKNSQVKLIIIKFKLF
jgi:hypothetical protein